MALLSQLEWPGNIRQLENAVYRAVVMSESDQLGAADFPQAAAHAPALPEARDQSEPLIVDPWPGRDSHRTVPPIAPSRSDMFTNP